MTKSRWANEFVAHPFQKVWENIKSDLENIEVDDPTVTTSVTELARLKRVVVYLDEIISTVDPDLTPRSVWSNFYTQADPCLQQIRSYASTKNIGHIQSANEHADNLLTYVRPFLILPQEAVDALKKSAQTYASQLENSITSFRDLSNSALEDVKNDRNAAANRLRGLTKTNEKINALAERLFEKTDTDISIEGKIERLLVDSTEKYTRIDELHKKLLVDTTEHTSTQTTIGSAEKEISERRIELISILRDANDRILELDNFHEKIFGRRNNEDNGIIGGLNAELDARLEQLDSVEKQHQAIHEALLKKINSLLPGASSAGLASAYRTLKESFNAPIQNYTKYFYISLGTIAIGTVIFAIEQINLWPPSITFVKIKEWDEMLRSLVGKAGFVLPLVWLAVFSARRRSQYERLQQEYAHKEAFASSYESYKKQLRDLNSDSDDLQRDLIAKAIDAIAYNASTTLNSKHHEEKPPLFELLEKTNIDGLQKISEILKGNKPPAGK